MFYTILNQLFISNIRWLPIILVMILSCSKKEDEIPVIEPVSYVESTMQDFTVVVREDEKDDAAMLTALDLLGEKLEEINTLLRDQFLSIIHYRKVWVKLDLTSGAAWYHPNRDWLLANGHNPNKAFCVEISNARNFVSWTEQNQPYMVLHEMAHLLHHQYFGHDYHAILTAFNKARESGIYESVPYFDGENTFNRPAYALENNQEYFAELTEAYYGKNDYYPFDYQDLKEFDTLGFALMESAWGPPPGKEHTRGIQPPMPGSGLDDFYQKYIDASGLPLISSWIVYDEALLIARDIVNHMVSALPPAALERMISDNVRIGIIGVNQVTTDMPEYSDLNEAFPGTNWDGFRGLGPTLARPLASAGEENLLQLPGDIYAGENILIHEFAHAIDLMGLRPTVEGFEEELRTIYQQAMEEGLWKNTYAAVNKEEYFAEGVQSWYNANAYANPPDGVHNHVNTREKLKEYDPRLYDLLARFFPDDDVSF